MMKDRGAACTGRRCRLARRRLQYAHFLLTAKPGHKSHLNLSFTVVQDSCFALQA